jgi:DNA-binding XRE family transcriptional regulator
MKKSRFTDEQKVKALRDAEATSVEVVSKKLGVAEQTISLWRKKFHGQSVDDCREMKALIVENARLKKLVAKQALSIEVLKEVYAKKW